MAHPVWSTLVAPPALRRAGAERDRHATWLELFLDLVFIVAVTALGKHVMAHPDPAGLATFLGLYLAVFIAWQGHTVYATRFDTDDLLYRTVTFALMFAALAMAIAVGEGTVEAFWRFGLSFAVARACLLALYVRAGAHAPETRPLTGVYLETHGVGLALWTVSLAVPAPWRYLVWAVAIAFEVANPWRHRRLLARFPLDPIHLPERFGLFTIIVLGESVLAVAAALGRVPPEGAWLVAASLAFGLAACVWWLYFTFMHHAGIPEQLRSGLGYMYLHLPLTAGLTLLGAGLERVITSAAKPEVPMTSVVLVGTGALVWLAAFHALQLLVDGHRLQWRLRWGFRGVMAGVVLLMVAGGGLSAVGLLGGLFALFFALAVLDLRLGLPAEGIATGADGGGVGEGPEGRAGDRGGAGPTADAEAEARVVR